MSLVSMMLRLSVSRLLAGRTWAGGRVLNSPIDPVTDLLEGDDQHRPLIAIFTNDEKQEGEGRDIGGKSAELDLIYFTYLTPALIRVDGIEFEARSSGGSTALDMLAHQIRVALLTGPAEWRAVYESLVVKASNVRTRPILVETENAIRIPAKEIVVSMTVVPEPDIGRPLDERWAAIDAAMRADEDAAPLADVVKAMIEQPADLAGWQLDRVNMALSEQSIRALGLAPADETEQDDPAAVTDVEYSGSNETVPPEGLP